MRNKKGAIIIVALIFVAVTLIVWSALLEFMGAENRLSLTKYDQGRALQVAEAGIDYYKWHLAHAGEDYQDGTGGAPITPCVFDNAVNCYAHDYQDTWGNTIGKFHLRITPPTLGSTIVTIESAGFMNNRLNIWRKIKVRFGKKSLADYGFLTNDDVWFGSTESTVGKVHANGGIRFDGTASSIVESTKETYTCRQWHGCNDEIKPGVWGAGGPQSFWQYPPAVIVPQVNFATITVDLQKIKEAANTPSGIYLNKCPGQCSGYRVKFNANTTITIYKVTSTTYTNGEAVDGSWGDHNIDINNQSILAGYNNHAPPANGLIFIEDKTWVDGVVNGRYTLAAANFPTGQSDRSIIINGNITYLNKDGNHNLGLMAQKDILIPRGSLNNLEINAALMAQLGSVQRYCFDAWEDAQHKVHCSGGSLKNTVQSYGSIISRGVWTWGWVDGGNNPFSGYQSTLTAYDPNLTYAPPPKFPVAGDFTLISWDEE